MKLGGWVVSHPNNEERQHSFLVLELAEDYENIEKKRK